MLTYFSIHALKEIKLLVAKGLRAMKIPSILFSLLIERSSYLFVYWLVGHTCTLAKQSEQSRCSVAPWLVNVVLVSDFTFHYSYFSNIEFRLPYLQRYLRYFTLSLTLTIMLTLLTLTVTVRVNLTLPTLLTLILGTFVNMAPKLNICQLFFAVHANFLLLLQFTEI